MTDEERREKNRLKAREATRRWREANRERHLEMVREWCKKNAERKRKNDAAWRDANRERIREYHHKRYLKKKNSSVEVPIGPVVKDEPWRREFGRRWNELVAAYGADVFLARLARFLKGESKENDGRGKEG